MTEQEEAIQPEPQQQQHTDIDVDTFIAILQAHREAQTLKQHAAEQVRQPNECVTTR
jgi:hypothetical protein